MKTLLKLFCLFVTILVLAFFHEKNEDLDESVDLPEFYNKNKESNGNNKTVMSRVFKKQQGYGNNVYTIISTIVIGILSDSRILIELDYMEPYVNTPFALSNSLNISDIHSKAIEVNVRQAYVTPKDLNILISTILPVDFTYLKYDHFGAYFFEVCSNPICHQKLVDNNLVDASIVNEAQNALKSVNMSVDEKMEKILRVGFEVASTVYNKYWFLNKNITDIVDKYVKEYFEGNYVIGIHIRRDFILDVDLDVFFKCAIEIQEKTVGGIKKPIKWFISTDYNEKVKEFRVQYPDKVFTSEGEAIHMGWYKAGYEKGLIDLELLSNCDEFITTAGSTFGFIPSLRHKKFSYYVSGKRNDTKCHKLSLSKPSVVPIINAAVF